jgi:hypothetical protein
VKVDDVGESSHVPFWHQSAREVPAVLPNKLLRFRDLKEIGLVKNWPTLKRRIENQGFPPGRILGPATRVWTETEVGLWFVSRPERRDNPPPENLKPGPSVGAEGTGRELTKSLSIVRDTGSDPESQEAA